MISWQDKTEHKGPSSSNLYLSMCLGSQVNSIQVYREAFFLISVDYTQLYYFCACRAEVLELLRHASGEAIRSLPLFGCKFGCPNLHSPLTA